MNRVFLRFSYSIDLEWVGEGERVSADLYPRLRRYCYMHASVYGGGAD